jgi:hypothetical protein
MPFYLRAINAFYPILYKMSRGSRQAKIGELLNIV